MKFEFILPSHLILAHQFINDPKCWHHWRWRASKISSHLGLKILVTALVVLTYNNLCRYVYEIVVLTAFQKFEFFSVFTFFRCYMTTCYINFIWYSRARNFSKNFDTYGTINIFEAFKVQMSGVTYHAFHDDV